MVFVAKVADIFHITGRGVVIVIDRDTWAPDVKIRNRDKIQLRTPDGRIFDTEIASIEFLSRPRLQRNRDNTGVVLPASIKVDQIPAGTEIWLLQDP